MGRRVVRDFGLAGPFVLALICLTFIVWAVVCQIHFPYDGISWSESSGEVFSVDPGGPAVGVMSQGDRILAINGIPPVDSAQVYEGLVAGDGVLYRLEREGEILERTVALMAPPEAQLARRLAPILVSGIFWLVGVGVEGYASRGEQSRLLFLWCLVASLGLGSGAVSGLAPRWVSMVFNSLLWFGGPLTLHLHLVFPLRKSSRAWKGLLVGWYMLAGVGASFHLVWLVEGSALVPWWPVLQTGNRVGLLLSFLVVIGLLVFSLFKAPDLEVRRQLRLLSFGGGLAVLLVALLVLLPEALMVGSVMPPEWGLVFFGFVPAAYGYAILRHRLIGIERYLSRGATHILVLTVLAGLYYVVAAIVNHVLPDEIRHRPGVTVAIVLAMAVGFVELRRRLQAFVDWVFYGGWYDRDSAVEGVVNGLEQIRDEDVLRTVVAERLRASLKLSSACVCLVREGSLEPTIAHRGSSGGTGEGVGLGESTQALDRRIVSRLGKRSDLAQVATLAELAEGADADGGPAPANARDTLVVPVLGREGLKAVMLVGPRIGGGQVNEDSFGVLRLIARQVAAAIERVQLLNELERRAREVEKLNWQIVRAREEERKRLARELHDAAIQSLVGLNFELSKLDDPGAEAFKVKVREIVDILRAVCSELRPPVLDGLGIVSAVRSLVQRAGRQDMLGPAIILAIEGNEEEWVPEETALCLYRFLQEALLNALKHAGAEVVNVSLSIGESEIVLAVQDDGRGFEVPRHLGEMMAQDRFGLVGVRERLGLVDGKLEIVSAPGSGTCLTARIPRERGERGELLEREEDEGSRIVVRGSL